MALKDALPGNPFWRYPPIVQNFLAVPAHRAEYRFADGTSSESLHFAVVKTDIKFCIMGDHQICRIEKSLDSGGINPKAFLLPKSPIGIAVDGLRAKMAFSAGIEDQVDVGHLKRTGRERRRIEQLHACKCHDPIFVAWTGRLNIEKRHAFGDRLFGLREPWSLARFNSRHDGYDGLR